MISESELKGSMSEPNHPVDMSMRNALVLVPIIVSYKSLAEVRGSRRNSISCENTLEICAVQREDTDCNKI